MQPLRRRRKSRDRRARAGAAARPSPHFERPGFRARTHCKIACLTQTGAKAAVLSHTAEPCETRVPAAGCLFMQRHVSRDGARTSRILCVSFTRSPSRVPVHYCVLLQQLKYLIILIHPVAKREPGHVAAGHGRRMVSPHTCHSRVEALESEGLVEWKRRAGGSHVRVCRHAHRPCSQLLGLSRCFGPRVSRLDR